MIGAFQLFRVDDRLLHGQVAHGWGRALDPAAYLLADDALAVDPEGALLFELAAPPGVVVAVMSLEQIASGARPADPARTVLLVRSIGAAAALLDAGVPGPVDLGGVHARPGAREYLPYLYLDDEDRAVLRRLLAQGHENFAQDLPDNPKHSLAAVLERGGGG
jgi:mannose/fructose/N-acetylgalactosamine-specific phosphotransferase system component IIB